MPPATVKKEGDFKDANSTNDLTVEEIDARMQQSGIPEMKFLWGKFKKRESGSAISTGRPWSVPGAGILERSGPIRASW